MRLALYYIGEQTDFYMGLPYPHTRLAPRDIWKLMGFIWDPPPYVHTGLLNMGHIVFFNTRTVKMYTDTHLKISEPNL